MNKSKIEWCDMTWSPITGCLHGCEYCYARGIARRFAGGGYGTQGGMFIAKYKEDAFQPPYDLLQPQLAKNKEGWYRNAPYPFGFEPTLHRYRLGEPAQLKKPQNIFVGSMTDMFGEWVPDEWIRMVFEACEAAPWHRYMFLTKNPGRYIELAENQTLKPHDNLWFGTTITKSTDPYFYTNFMPHNTFLSIEPLLEDFGDGSFDPCIRWVIIGAMTGPGAKKHQPRREWVDNIVDQCRAADVPVFMKNSLVPIMGEKNMIREFPDGLRK